MPQMLRYARSKGFPASMVLAGTSLGLSLFGLLGLLVAWLAMSFRYFEHAQFFLALPCMYPLLAPLGIALGAIVNDERRDIARIGKIGAWLNTIWLLAYIVALGVVGFRFLW